MRNAFLGLAAGVLALSLAGTAGAHPFHGGHERHREVAHYGGHGVRFSGGYYYPGHDHHWARRVWDARYQRYIYCDPALSVYYYWYAPGNCYYPVTYCP